MRNEQKLVVLNSGVTFDIYFLYTTFLKGAFFYFIVKFYLYCKINQSHIWFTKSNSVLMWTPYLKTISTVSYFDHNR